MSIGISRLQGHSTPWSVEEASGTVPRRTSLWGQLQGGLGGWDRWMSHRGKRGQYLLSTFHLLRHLAQCDAWRAVRPQPFHPKSSQRPVWVIIYSANTFCPHCTDCWGYSAKQGAIQHLTLMELSEWGKQEINTYFWMNKIMSENDRCFHFNKRKQRAGGQLGKGQDGQGRSHCKGAIPAEGYFGCFRNKNEAMTKP